MGTAAAVKFRIKGTGLYVQPQPRASLSSAYETTGSGRRSVAMRAGNYGPSAAIDYAAAALTNQAREADRKNGVAKVIADRLTTNIVGTGIIPQPKSARAKRLWLRWTDEADPAGMLDFYGLQAQITRAMIVSGEAFCRLRVRMPSDGLSVPLQIQVLESDYVPYDKNEVLPNGGYIRQGIEFNASGRRVAYWMYRQHPAERQLLPSSDFMPTRVPASEVLHVYDAFSARPGQIRGVPWVTQALAKMRDLDAYDDAELIRKKMSAMLVAFISKKDLASEGVTEAELNESFGDDATIADDGVADVTLAPGSTIIGEDGESIQWSSPQDVGGQYQVFMRQQLRAISSYAGLLYEQLTGDFSDLNDRTWRAAFNEFRRRCEMWQHHLVVFQFCRPVWMRWASLARMSGALRPSEAPDTVKWIPQAWPYINPKQDIEAAQLEIRAGMASRSEKASERGKDANEIDAEQAADNARADRLGLRFDSDGRQKKTGGSDGTTEADAADTEADEPISDDDEDIAEAV